MTSHPCVSRQGQHHVLSYVQKYKSAYGLCKGAKAGVRCRVTNLGSQLQVKTLPRGKIPSANRYPLTAST
jgi:hypothetical protein